MKLRLPPELKAQIEQAAATAGRSMNAEIVTRLEKTFRDEVTRELIVPFNQEESEVLEEMAKKEGISADELATRIAHTQLEKIVRRIHQELLQGYQDEEK